MVTRRPERKPPREKRPREPKPDAPAEEPSEPSEPQQTAVDRFVRCARRQVGKPYVWATAGPDTFDCSGLVAFCHEEATGQAITRSSHAQFGLGAEIPARDVQSGDLLFYDTAGDGAGHVGIAVGVDRAVHALNPAMGVRETGIAGANLGGPFIGARRLDLGDTTVPTIPDEQPGIATVTAASPFRLVGNTDFVSFASALGRTVDQRIVSPPSREARAIYDALVPSGLTRLAAVMAWIERKNDTHEPSYAYYGPEFHNLWAVTGGSGGNRFRRFGSYREAAEHWGPYVLGETYAGLGTLREFINRYAPPFENDTERYVRQLVEGINALPLLAGPGPEPEPEPDPEPIPWSPVIYDLRNDPHAARFGLTPAERDRIVAKKIPGRNGMQPQSIGLHVQWGTTPGSLRHWLGVSASSTVMVQRDGSILRVIPEADGPWTQGDVKNPDARARTLMQRFGSDPNVYSLTIEAEDERTEAITATQERTILWQIREWQRKWPQLVDPERILGHYEINAVDRARCGRYRDDIVSMLAGSVPEPEPIPVPGFPGLPTWLPADALRSAFPLADPEGPVTRHLITWIAAEGRLPWFLEKIDLGGGRNVWRFDRVTLFNDGSSVWVEGEAA